jgi:hypothetical protein
MSSGRGFVRRRLALPGLMVALLILLALPATASAGSAYSYRVIENYCDGGEPNIRVRMIKPAGYYPNKFTIDATGQHSNSGNGNWSKESSTSHFSKTVPNQYARFTWTKGIYWDPPDNQWHRIKVIMKVWDDGHVVAQRTIYSVKC